MSCVLKTHRLQAYIAHKFKAIPYVSGYFYKNCKLDKIEI